MLHHGVGCGSVELLYNNQMIVAVATLFSRILRLFFIEPALKTFAPAKDCRGELEREQFHRVAPRFGTA
jgi:hypothetical protein